MHPVSYLFEDIYRNYWGITPADVKERTKGPVSRWAPVAVRDEVQQSRPAPLPLMQWPSRPVRFRRLVLAAPNRP